MLPLGTAALVARQPKVIGIGGGSGGRCCAGIRAEMFG